MIKAGAPIEDPSPISWWLLPRRVADAPQPPDPAEKQLPLLVVHQLVVETLDGFPKDGALDLALGLLAE